MSKKQKPFKTLADDLKAIRNRPVPLGEIEKYNKIMDDEEKQNAKKKSPQKKIARSPETSR